MRAFCLLLALLFATAVHAAGSTITPEIQAELDKEKTTVRQWAADPILVDAVKQQNKVGPIEGMDNAKWKALKRSDPQIKAFQENAAGKRLTELLAAGKGRYSEAFLSAAQGEKAAFVEKTTSYIHKGSPKFDTPMNSGENWQGKIEFDESTQTYAVQVGVPVQADGKTIGVLVVGINLADLEKARK